VGLFVLVGGLVKVGVIDALGTAALGVVGDKPLLAATSLLFGSAVLGAFVDNIPSTAAMAPIVETLVAATADPNRVAPCGGPSPSEPTWEATPPPSPPEQTSS
jgi:Na+/H+ antiporter NhaD/arsenite permease-like protein